MIFNEKTNIEVSKLVVDTGSHHGVDTDEMMLAGLKVAQESLLRGPVRNSVREALRTRKFGLLLVVGQTGSRYGEVECEIAGMAVPDVTQISGSPMLLNEIVTRSHVQAALVASHHTIVIASLHAIDALRAKVRLSAILGQDVNDGGFDLIGIVETRAISPARDEGWQTMRPALVVRYLAE